MEIYNGLHIDLGLLGGKISLLFIVQGRSQVRRRIQVYVCEMHVVDAFVGQTYQRRRRVSRLEPAADSESAAAG